MTHQGTMIPVCTTNVEQASWQETLQQSIKQVDDLLLRLALDKATLPYTLSDDETAFSCRVPLTYIARMRLNDPWDPLLLQVLPRSQEQLSSPGFTADPLGEQHVAQAGILQKYHGRCLLILSSHCAVHCRYCFRREFPYSAHRHHQAGWREKLTTLANDHSIQEIILSGGDPLSLSDENLIALFATLTQMPHIRLIRVHTRLPVVIPNRLTPALLRLFAESQKKVVLVLHINHPNEIDDVLGAQLARLREHHITCFNQSVLLNRVNDCADTLKQLSFRLFDHSVIPYYLHVLDHVSGTQHFSVNDHRIQDIYRQLRAQLPGYLLPRLVQEIPGATAKQAMFVP